MELRSIFTIATLIISVTLFAGMLGGLALGRWMAHRRAEESGSAEMEAGVGAMNGAVFGLLGLLIAFSFSGAAERFEGRRTLLVQEANAIGTAYLRLDVLQPDVRSKLQEKFRRYVDERLACYNVKTFEEIETARARVATLQGQIWTEALTAARDAGGSTPVVILPALNEMIDITTTQNAAQEAHPPRIIHAMLMLISLVSAVLAGMGMPLSHPNWVPRIVYAAATAFTIFIVLDLEYPRLGMIRIDDADHLLRDVRASMH